MPNTLGRNLNLCFTKIRLPRASQSSTTMSTPTPPNPDDQNRPFPSNTATTSTTSILIKNFNSLYECAFDSTTSKSLRHSPSSLSTDSEIVPVADFAIAFASQRFFFSTPGRSKSIIESTKSNTLPSTSAATLLGPDQTVFNNSVAVPTFSPDPYADFRRSMQEMVEMVEARGLMDVKKSNWEFLPELLLYYLALNPKATHKFIIGAFSDLLVSLLPSHPNSGGQLEADDFVAGVCETSRSARKYRNVVANRQIH